MTDKIQQFYYKKSRIQQLKGFCYTVQKGSSKEAAKKMGLDPSTISLQIKSLEDDLEMKLFDRISKKLILTEKGKEFYKKAVECLQSVDSLFENFLLAEDKNYQNSLNIASFDNILSHFVIPIIADFKKINQNKNITIYNIKKDVVFNQMIDRKIDIAVYPFLEKTDIPPELELIKICNYTSYWVMHKDNILASKPDEQITRENIAESEFLYIPELVNIGNFKNFIDDYKIKSAINIKNGTLEILKSMISNGLGIGCLPNVYINKEKDENIVCKRLQHLFSPIIYGCLVNKEPKKITKDFIKILLEKNKN